MSKQHAPAHLEARGRARPEGEGRELHRLRLDGGLLRDLRVQLVPEMCVALY